MPVSKRLAGIYNLSYPENNQGNSHEKLYMNKGGLVTNKEGYGMKSAAAMSMEIRRKKKAMQADRDVVDLGGSPSMDAQDIYNDRKDQATAALDENEPKMHSDGEDLSNAAESAQEAETTNETHSDDRQSNEDAGIKEKMLKRKARLRSMMMK